MTFLIHRHQFLFLFIIFYIVFSAKFIRFFNIAAKKRGCFPCRRCLRRFRCPLIIVIIVTIYASIFSIFSSVGDRRRSCLISHCVCLYFVSTYYNKNDYLFDSFHEIYLKIGQHYSHLEECNFE